MATSPNTIISYPDAIQPLDGTEAYAAWQNGGQKQITGFQLAQFLLNGIGSPTDASAVAADLSAQLSAMSASQAAVAAAIQGGITTPVSAGGALPFEVTSITGGGGTGGTAGTYAGITTGGPAGFKWQVVVGSDGKAVPQIVNSGISTSNAVPTLTMPTIAGLTGATAPAATVGVIAVGRVFYAPSSDSTQLLAWGNNAGALASAPFGGAQIALYQTTGVNNVIASLNNIIALLIAAVSEWNAVAGVTSTGKYSNSSGADDAATGYAYDTFVVPAQQTGIRVTTTTVNTSIPLANYYSDAAGTVFISHSAEFGGDGSGTTYTQHALALPAGTKCVKINHGSTNAVLFEAYEVADVIDRLIAVETTISSPTGTLADTVAFVQLLRSVISFAEGPGISFGQSDGTYGAMIDEGGLSQSAGGGEGGRDNTNYLLAVVPDSAGKMQVQLINRTTSVAAWTTSGASNKSNPTFGEGDIVRYFDDAGGSMIEMYVPIAGGTPKPVLPSSVISAVGDSLTESHPIDTGSPPNSLEMMLSAMLGGRTVNNFGIQGQTSIEIAARQGGAPSLLTVTDNQIPASGSVAVTAYSVDLLYNVGLVTGSPSLTGTVAGVPCTLVDSLSNARGGTYALVRTADGEAVECPAGTPFIPDIAVAHAGDIQTFIYGRNNPSLSPILASLAASVAYLTPLSKRFIVGSVLNQLTETIGTAGYNGIMAINAGLQAAYPNNYLDLASPPTPDEIAWVTANYGYVLTTQDSTDIANGTFPTGMRPPGDPTHLNLYGYAIWARRFYNFIIAKGW